MAPEPSQNPSTPRIWRFLLYNLQSSGREGFPLTVLLPARQLLAVRVRYDQSRQAAGPWYVLDPHFRGLRILEID